MRTTGRPWPHRMRSVAIRKSALSGSVSRRQGRRCIGGVIASPKHTSIAELLAWLKRHRICQIVDHELPTRWDGRYSNTPLDTTRPMALNKFRRSVSSSCCAIAAPASAKPDTVLRATNTSTMERPRRHFRTRDIRHAHDHVHRAAHLLLKQCQHLSLQLDIACSDAQQLVIE